MIGVLAGMGPFSTGPFLGRVLEECQRQYGSQDDDSFPPMVIASWPTPFQPEQATDARQMVTALTAGGSEACSDERLESRLASGLVLRWRKTH